MPQPPAQRLPPEQRQGSSTPPKTGAEGYVTSVAGDELAAEVRSRTHQHGKSDGWAPSVTSSTMAKVNEARVVAEDQRRARDSGDRDG